jgi:hypothetical protein
MKEASSIFAPHIIFYYESIRFHCQCALSSVDFVASFIDMSNETKGNYEMTDELRNQILDNLQNILVHSAAISRYFWPSYCKDKTNNNIFKRRGLELKDMFQLNDKSPLKSRELRNALEHFDENLDLYLHEKPLVGHVFPAYVGGYPESEVPLHFFRAYYIDIGIFEVLGSKFEVQPIVDEIYKIYNHMHTI